MFGVNTSTNMALPSIKQKKIRQPAINSLRVKTIPFEHFLDYYFSFARGGRKSRKVDFYFSYFFNFDE